MKRGPFETYPEWLTTVDTELLQRWVEKEGQLITEGNEFASVFVGPYPVQQEASESDEDFERDAGRPIKVRRTLRLQWYAAELERRANGGAIAPKVRF